MSDKRGRIPPAGGWRHRRTSLWAAAVLPLALMGLLVTAIIGEAARGVAGAPIAVLIAACVGVAVLSYLVFRALWVPLAELRHWAARVAGGNLAARIPAPAYRGEFADLISDINAVGEALDTLKRDHASGISPRIAARWLEIVNGVTAGIASAADLDDLLARFLFALRGANEIRAGIVRLLTDDGALRLVASIGLPEDVVAKEQWVPLTACLCGQAAASGVMRMGADLQPCCQNWGRDLFPGEEVALLAVPLCYEGRVIGLYNLFMERARITGHGEVTRLLLEFGRHLGAAIAKVRLQDARRELVLLEERMTIAHELHDSLAQTLASLRIQAQVLGETLQEGEDGHARAEFQRLHAGLEIAHKEVRDLIRNWRAVGAEGGLLPALDSAIGQFRAETGISVFVQKDWHEPLPVTHQTHVLRVIQEALSNVRKHAHARTVRVLLARAPAGDYRVLIEDDGEGRDMEGTPCDPDAHFGQAIMRERARALGGELRVECEPGEGTRVILTFRDPVAGGRQALKGVAP